jgi:hypothetical protein
MTTISPSWRLLAAREWLNEVTYKPGWRFDLWEGFPGTSMPSSYGVPVVLLISALTHDSMYGIDPAAEEFTRIDHGMILPDRFVLDKNVFLDAVYQQILLVEQHETREFFRVRGERLFNPHPKPGVVEY